MEGCAVVGLSLIPVVSRFSYRVKGIVDVHGVNGRIKQLYPLKFVNIVL